MVFFSHQVPLVQWGLLGHTADSLGLFGPQPGPAAESFSALGSTHSWQHSVPVSKWVRAVFLSVKSVAFGT